MAGTDALDRHQVRQRLADAGCEERIDPRAIRSDSGRSTISRDCARNDAGVWLGPTRSIDTRCVSDLPTRVVKNASIHAQSDRTLADQPSRAIVRAMTPAYGWDRRARSTPGASATCRRGL